MGNIFNSIKILVLQILLALMLFLMSHISFPVNTEKKKNTDSEWEDYEYGNPPPPKWGIHPYWKPLVYRGAQNNSFIFMVNRKKSACVDF